MNYETKLNLVANNWAWDDQKERNDYKAVKDYIHDAYVRGFLNGVKKKTKKARWYHRRNVYEVVYCSECQNMIPITKAEDMLFCYNCGCQMENDTQKGK